MLPTPAADRPRGYGLTPRPVGRGRGLIVVSEVARPMQFINDLLADPATLVCAVIAVLVLAFGTAFLVLNTRLVQLVLKNLRRNLVRTLLTCMATMVLVFMITMIWT